MAAVYSVLIFEGHDLGATTDIALDPAYVWIVRDIDIFFPGDTVSISAGLIAAATNGTVFGAGTAAVGPQGENHQWRGRQVFVPTGAATLKVYGSSALGDGPDVRISGYRLTPP